MNEFEPRFSQAVPADDDGRVPLLRSDDVYRIHPGSIVAVVVAAFYACQGSTVRAAEGAQRFTNAVQCRHFSFEYEDDQDYDSQPDEWVRRRGPGFPAYVHAEIDRTIAAEGKQSLRFDLNGGQAAFYSSPIRVNASHSYVVRGKIRTRDLEHNAAVLSVSLLDHRRQRITRILSQPVTGNHAEWVTVWVGPFQVDSQARFLVFGTHIVESDRNDIRGSVWFDDIWLGSLPRLELSIANRQHYVPPGESISIEAEATGVSTVGEHRLRLQLFDAENRKLDESLRAVQVLRPPSAEKSNSPLLPDIPFSLFTKETTAAIVPHRWMLKSQNCGFYRVHATLERDALPLLEKETTFVVAAPVEFSKSGEFGWSLAGSPQHTPFNRLGDILAQAGINWVKLPLWSVCQPQNKDFDHVGLAQLLDRLEPDGVSMIGLLSDPPLEMQEKFGRNWDGVSKIFMMPRSFWYPSLEPVIARYSFRIRSWQLGGEQDKSFVGLSTLSDALQAVKAEFDRIGTDARIGFNWDWQAPVPPTPLARGSYLSRSGAETMTSDQLQAAVASAKKDGIPSWVLLRTLPPGKNTLTLRAADLVRRMLAAKIANAEAIFLDDPLNPHTGIVHSDGAPRELFLPWQITAGLLRGSKYLGQLDLPMRSPNAVIARPQELIVYLWNPQPVREEIYLGEGVAVFDLWGRPCPSVADQSSGCRFVEVGPTPVILRGCSSPIARWLLSTRFEKGKLRSEYGSHDEALLGENTFPQGVTGKVTLHLPHEWQVEPNHWTLQVAAGEKFRLPTQLTFPPNASLGHLRPTVEFEISADRPYRFTMHLPYQLGLGDLTLRVNGRYLPDGRLEIEQQIINNTQPPETLDFNCNLFIPGRIRQKQRVTKLGPGVDKRFYYIPQAEQLRGKELWLRAEQVDGRRLLNYRLKLEK